MHKTTYVTRTLIACAFALLLAPHALAQQEAQQPSVFEGQLLEVDPATQTIVAGDPESDQSMTFSYNEDTAVTGSVENVQGLNGQAGAQLRVSYETQGESNVATRIEVVELPRAEQ